MGGPPSVSLLLIAWGRGEPAALEQLTPRVYHELHKPARAYLSRGRRNQWLQPTAPIKEAYLRLLDQAQPVQWENRDALLRHRRPADAHDPGRPRPGPPCRQAGGRRGRRHARRLHGGLSPPPSRWAGDRRGPL